jgi:hypothetical protein
LGDPNKENTMKTTSEETEKTKTETETETAHHNTAHHNKEAETVILPSDKELAAQGFYHRGGKWGFGVAQDFRNIRLAPSGDKLYHLGAGMVKSIGIAIVVEGIAEDAYKAGKWCLAKLAARKAAAKAASKLTGLEVGDSAEVAMTATAMWY